MAGDGLTQRQTAGMHLSANVEFPSSLDLTVTMKDQTIA